MYHTYAIIMDIRNDNYLIFVLFEIVVSRVMVILTRLSHHYISKKPIYMNIHMRIDINIHIYPRTPVLTDSTQCVS